MAKKFLSGPASLLGEKRKLSTGESGNRGKDKADHTAIS